MSLYSDITSQENGPLIRLLALLPSTGPLYHEDPIECILMVISLSDADGDYEALSYCWGGIAATQTITCNGQSVKVTQNLHDALRHVRQTDKPRRLWIDALCVDQQNPAERQAQVSFMRDIFNGAERVLIWLGAEADHSPRVFALCERMIDKRGAMLEAGNVTTNDFLLVPTRERLDRQLEIMEALAAAKEHEQAEGSSESSSAAVEGSKSKKSSFERWLGRMQVKYEWKLTEPKPGEIDAFLALLRRPYWTRVWIVQEICLAREAVVLCGNDSMDLSTLIVGFVLVMVYGKTTFSQQPEEVSNFGLVQLLDTRRTRQDWVEAVGVTANSAEDEDSGEGEGEDEEDLSMEEDCKETEDVENDGDRQASSDVDGDKTVRGEQTSTHSHMDGDEDYNKLPGGVVASTHCQEGDENEKKSKADANKGDNKSDQEEEEDNDNNEGPGESGDENQPPEPLELLTLLWDYRPHDATDPRDKVYALLGLPLPLDAAPDIKADYTISLAECYARAAKAIVARTRTLDVLRTPAPHGDERVPIPGLPSWAPDWRGGKRRDLALPLFQNFSGEAAVSVKKWAAAGNASGSIQPTSTQDGRNEGAETLGRSDNGNKHDTCRKADADTSTTNRMTSSPVLSDWLALLLSGHTVDTIATLAPVLQNMTADFASLSKSKGLAAMRIATDIFAWAGLQIETWLQWESLALSQHEPYPQTGESLLDAYFGTITASSFPTGRERARTAFDRWRAWLATPSLLRRWIGAGSPSQVQGQTETGTEPGSETWRRAGLVTSAISHVFTQVDDAGMEALIMACPIRRFAVTRRGRFALVPAQTCSGDEVALLRGSCVPVVVRRVGGRWNIVGAAYVHGIMFGEAWDEALAQDMEFV